MNDNSSKVIEVDINDILPNRFQPRIQFDEEEILELSDSIKEHGVIQPIVVRTIGDKYEIIAGERRYKASVLAGKETVPVIVKNLNDKDSAEIALIENVQRKNLTPIEEALSYKKILDMGYITQEKLAEKLGKSQSSVANKIRLLNLSDEVQEALLENKISERHARSLLKLSTTQLQNKMLDRIIKERLTVRKTDEEIERMKNQTSEEGNSDSQKIIEKGEMNMNNNMMPNMPSVDSTNSTNLNFDIFGTNNLNVAQSQPAVNEQSSMQGFNIFENPSQPTIQNPVVQEASTQNFDIFAPSFTSEQNPVNQTAPVSPITEPSSFMAMPQTNINVPSQGMPVVEPQMPNMEFNLSTPVMPQQEVTTNQSQILDMNFNPNLSMMPQTEPTTMQPQASEMNFNSNPTIVSQPELSTIEQPQMGEMTFETNSTFFGPAQQPQEAASFVNTETSVVPETSPIIENPVPTMESQVQSSAGQMEQQSDNLFSFGSNDVMNNTSNLTTPSSEQASEFKMPEPIIITDYNKQYDPVMPQTMQNLQPKVDFKEVINAIRECSAKIEQYGYKIDVEEYDLANLYQVIFKVEK